MTNLSGRRVTKRSSTTRLLFLGGVSQGKRRNAGSIATSGGLAITIRKGGAEEGHCSLRKVEIEGEREREFTAS